MTHTCSLCGYTTKHKFNFLKHQNRKTSCKKSNVEIQQNVQSINQNDDQNKQNSNKEFNCNKCGKVMCNKQRLLSHINRCKGVDTKTCHRCFKVFTSVQTKYKHLKNVDCEKDNPSLTTSIIDNRVNNSHNQNSFNTNNIVNNNNIMFNCFGKENLEHISSDGDLIHKTNMFSKNGLYGLIDLMEYIYFDPNHPENNTIAKMNERGEDIFIKNEVTNFHAQEETEEKKPMKMRWEFRDYEDIRTTIIESISSVFKMYNSHKNNKNIKLTEKKERKRIKEFIILLLTVGGFIEDDLAEELDIDIDDDMENEEKINNKFDKATLMRLFQCSNNIYKKNNGNIVKIKK